LKTNNHWYPYPEHGSYYKLDNGELMQCPMNADDSRDDSQASIDFAFTDEKDKPTLRAIIKDLELKD
jgi:hypothetical protein